MLRQAIWTVVIFCIIARSMPSSATHWVPPFTVGEYFALKISGELLPPTDLAARIDDDLQAIIEFSPAISEFYFFPDFYPGKFQVTLNPTAFAEWQAGTYQGFDQLFSEFGHPEVRPYSTSWLLPTTLELTFQELYHPEVLGSYFALADGVSAVSNGAGVIGIGSYLDVELPQYTFSHGWGDCPAGCINWIQWIF